MYIYHYFIIIILNNQKGSKVKEKAKMFFREYGSTFDSWDMDKFSSFFHEPFISIRGNGKSVIMHNQSEAKRFFTRVLNSWKKDGYKKFQTKDYEVQNLGEESMLVTFTWQMINKDNVIIRQWRQSYNLVKYNNEWKIIMSTFHINK